MSYEHCDTHDEDATNGCYKCFLEIVGPHCCTDWELDANHEFAYNGSYRLHGYTYCPYCGVNRKERRKELEEIADKLVRQWFAE